jgi:hypothetical protein
MFYFVWAVSTSGCLASNVRVVNEQRIGEDLEGNSREIVWCSAVSSGVVTICTVRFILKISPLSPLCLWSSYVYRNKQRLFLLNSFYRFGFCNVDSLCFLWSKYFIVKYYLDEFRTQEGWYSITLLLKIEHFCFVYDKPCFYFSARMQAVFMESRRGFVQSFQTYTEIGHENGPRQLSSTSFLINHSQSFSHTMLCKLRPW